MTKPKTVEQKIETVIEKMVKARQIEDSDRDRLVARTILTWATSSKKEAEKIGPEYVKNLKKYGFSKKNKSGKECLTWDGKSSVGFSLLVLGALGYIIQR